LDNAKKIFAKLTFAYGQLPIEYQNTFLKRKIDNKQELQLLRTLSSIQVDTDGRSGTFSKAHISEYAKMTPLQAHNVVNGTFPAVETTNGKMIVEYTAQGYNHGKTFWDETVKIDVNNIDKYDSRDFENRWAGIFIGTGDTFIKNAYIPKDLKIDEIKKDYNELADIYGLTTNVWEKYKLKDGEFYWYYTKVKEHKQNVREEYPFTAQEAFISNGKMVFDVPSINKLTVKKPLAIAHNGALSVFAIPVKGRKYVLGVDTSLGNINSDFGAIVVMDCKTFEVVATYKERIEPYLLAKVCNDIGEQYNEACISVERNAMGVSTIDTLRYKHNYKNIYEHTDKKWGWITTAQTKVDMMLGDNGLNKAINDGSLIANDERLVDELIHYEYKKNNSMGAIKGHNDDLLMATAIALMSTTFALAKGDVYYEGFTY